MHRDWGYAGTMFEAIYEIMQYNIPDDWVVATGEAHTVREFVQKAFEYVGLDWEKFVSVDKNMKDPMKSIIFLVIHLK